MGVYGSRRRAILGRLKLGPASNADLQVLLDEIGPYVARTMAELIKLGLARNLTRGRGRPASYVITDAGRAHTFRSNAEAA